MTRTTHTDVRTALRELAQGDVVRVPQYENALEVTFVSDDSSFVGVEFLDESQKTDATKSLIANEHSDVVGLIAGQSDKGDVDEIEILTTGADPEGGLDEEQVDADLDGATVTRLESQTTGKVVFEIETDCGRTMAVHHDGEAWVLNGHQGFESGHVELSRAETKADAFNAAADVVSVAAL